MRIKLNADVAHIATIIHSGFSTFAIWSVNDSGEKTDLIVSEIGKYAGTRPVDFQRTQRR